MTFYLGVRGGKGMWLEYGCDLDHHADCSIRNPAITQQSMSKLRKKKIRITLKWNKEQLIEFLEWSG